MRFRCINCGDPPDGFLFAHAARHLLPNRSALTFAVCLREQDRGLPARRPHHNPALRPAIVRELRRVFQQFEPELPNEERDRLVVVPDDDRDLFEKGAHRSFTCG